MSIHTMTNEEVWSEFGGDTATNPVVKWQKHDDFPHDVIQTYADGTVDAISVGPDGFGITPGFATVDECVEFLRSPWS